MDIIARSFLQKSMFIFNIFVISFFGLAIGSFITAIAVRISNEEKVFVKRSKCDTCNNVIPYFYLIPIFGYFLCNGKCKFCKQKVSIQYTLWEAFHAMLYIIIYILAKQNIFLFLPFALLTSVLLMIAIIDIKTQYVYDFHIVILAFCILYVLYYTQNLHISYKSFIVAGIPLVFKYFYEFIRFKLSGEKMEVIGMGDIKIFIILFFFLDFYILLQILTLSGLLGAGYGLILRKTNSHYAFMPAISLSLYFVLIYNFL